MQNFERHDRKVRRVELLPSLIVLGCITTGAFAQDQDCKSNLTGSPATMVEQKSAPDLMDPASDEKLLSYDSSTRMNLAADRAKSTRDGVSTELNIKELIDSEFTVFDPAYVTHRKERQDRFNLLRLRLDDAKRLKQFRYCSEQLFEKPFK